MINKYLSIAKDISSNNILKLLSVINFKEENEILSVIMPTGNVVNITNVDQSQLQEYFDYHPMLLDLDYNLIEISNNSKRRVLKLIPNPKSA